MIRLVYVLRRLPDLSREEFQRYWREIHGPLAAKHSTTLKARRYVQTHTIDDPQSERMRERRGTMEPYDGVAELWWNNEDEFTAAGATPEGRQAGKELLEDEKNFIDFSRSTMWLAMELPQVNPSPENIVARPESPIIRQCYFVQNLPDLSLEEAQLYWRTHHGPLVRSVAPAIRLKRYMQVHRVPSTLIDPLRESRGKMEEPFMGQAEVWYDRAESTGARGTPEGTQAIERLIEDEAKFIDFSRSASWAGKEHVFIDR